MNPKLWPNREGLAKIYAADPKLAIALALLDTGTEVGHRIAASLDWLFTETEVQAVPLVSLFAEAKRLHKESGDYGRGTYNGPCANAAYIRVACEQLGIPMIDFWPLEDKDVQDFELPKGLSHGLQVGQQLEIAEMRVTILYYNPDANLLGAPADMILFNEADRPKLEEFKELPRTDIQIEAETRTARMIHSFLTQS